jgi:hypothetical protein
MRRFALLLLAAPLALAACGGGSSPALKLDPVAYVRHAARATAATSEHVTMSEDYGAATTTGSGDYSSNPGTGSVVVSLHLAAGHTAKFQTVVSGSSVYQRETAPDAGDVAPGKKWGMVDFVKYPHLRLVDPAMELARSPMKALQQLEAAGTVTEVGPETIEGAATTHYRVTALDLSKLPPTANSAYVTRPEYRPIDVWIGTSDGYVYRDKTSVTDRAYPGSPPVTSAVNFSKFGEAVHVTIPPASETLDIGKLGG